MRRLTPSVTLQHVKATDAVQACCPDCGLEALVYENGLVRCRRKPCASDGRSKLFEPTRRREPALYALQEQYEESRHASKRSNGRKRILERFPMLKRSGRCASTSARA